MKPSAEQRTQIKPGQIVQVDPACDLDLRADFLAIDEVHSWGVVAHLLNMNVHQPHRLVWANIEMTGGTIVWDRRGDRVKPPEQQVKHHA